MLSTQDMPLVSIVKRLMIKLCSSISNLLFRSLFYFKISIMSMLCLSEVDFVTKTFMFISFTFIPSLKLPLTLCNYFSQSHLSLIISEKLMQSHNSWRAGKKKARYKSQTSPTLSLFQTFIKVLGYILDKKFSKECKETGKVQKSRMYS